MEFRAFVKDSKMLALQQKDETAHYPQIDDLKPVVFERCNDLVAKLSCVPFKTYILDVYIDIAPRHKAWVQDISPLLPEFMQDNELFNFDEVQQLKMDDEAEFRTLSEDS